MADPAHARRSGTVRGVGALRAATLTMLFAGAQLVVGCSTASPASVATPTSMASRETAPPGFALIGSWTTTISKEDLSAAGIDDPGLLNENSGTFTWAFEADGTWRQVQASLDGSPIIHPIFSGSYVVADGGLTVVTEFPTEYRDDVVRYTYIATADSVTFALLDAPDQILPIIVESHPWMRSQP